MRNRQRDHRRLLRLSGNLACQKSLGRSVDHQSSAVASMLIERLISVMRTNLHTLQHANITRIMQFYNAKFLTFAPDFRADRKNSNVAPFFSRERGTWKASMKVPYDDSLLHLDTAETCTPRKRLCSPCWRTCRSTFVDWSLPILYYAVECSDLDLGNKEYSRVQPRSV